MGFLAGKRALVVGLASERSIAFGIANAFRREGAELAFTYQGERLRERVQSMAREFDSDLTYPMDVSNDGEIDAAFAALQRHWSTLDIIVHSVGFAPIDQLTGNYVDVVTRDGFRIAHDISAYSLVALAKAGRPMMRGRKGAIITLSYLGAVRAVPNYNVMGPAKASLEANVRFLAYSLGPEDIRVNAISAGPIRTLAASGVKGIREMLKHVQEEAPLRRNVSIEDVGNAAAFLCSDLAAGITGEILYVDAGYSHVGMSID